MNVSTEVVNERRTVVITVHSGKKKLRILKILEVKVGCPKTSNVSTTMVCIYVKSDGGGKPN